MAIELLVLCMTLCLNTYLLTQYIRDKTVPCCNFLILQITKRVIQNFYMLAQSDGLKGQQNIFYELHMVAKL